MYVFMLAWLILHPMRLLFIKHYPEVSVVLPEYGSEHSRSFTFFSEGRVFCKKGCCNINHTASCDSPFGAPERERSPLVPDFSMFM